MKSLYYILESDREIRGTNDVLEWAAWFEDFENRRIDVTKLPNDVRVSTVFLGVDHNFTEDGPPLIFETMVFGGEHDGACERYSDIKEAKAGHVCWVEMIKGNSAKMHFTEDIYDDDMN